jgi:tetratricopeptide (TPR) repeat protein
MFRKAFGQSDLPLSDFELRRRQQKQKRLILFGAGLLVLLGLGYLAARPTLNAVRGWQARRHAQKAFAFIDKEQWGPARDEAIAGYQLRPNEPQAIRAVARLFSRAGQPDGLKFWKELETHSTLDRADLRDEASLALRARELDVADAALKELTGKREGGPTPGDWLLAAQLSLQKQNSDDAIVHVRQVFASSNATEREKLQATLLLDSILRGREGADLSEVFSRLDALARSPTSVGLEALVALAQRIQNSNAGSHNADVMSAEEVMRALETHPLGGPQHKLLAIDLRIHEQPAEKEKLVRAAVDQYKTGDNVALIALAAWLNSHGEFQRELDAIPRERAMQTRELFSQHVDALGALGRWDDIRRLIESEQFPLDPVEEHMYLARCFAQQGQTSGAENNWQRALQAAAGDVGKLMKLAEYAEKNGALKVAADSFDAAVAVAPKSRPAQQGRLRVAYAERDTRKILAILTDLLQIWSTDTAVQNDEAYARLLLLPSSVVAAVPAALPSASVTSPDNKEPVSNNPELTAIENLAAKLVEREPSSLSHRTLLALARLKLNRPADAMMVYKDINVPKGSLTTSSIAVHAAVLAANGHAEEARAEFARIPEDKILPEEKALGPR